MNDKQPTVAVFAATDGTCGAGLFADVDAIRLSGCQALTITTAVTAQNLRAVLGLWSLPATAIFKQFDAISAASISVIKIGVIAEHARTISECLKQKPKSLVVWDPVVAASADGSLFADEKRRLQMLRRLAPQVFVATPNRSELRLLSGMDDLYDGAQKLLAAGVKNVLVTDACEGSYVRHALFPTEGKMQFVCNSERLRNTYHGSGCFFSSTLAAHLAKGDKLLAAIVAAHRKTMAAILFSRSSSVPGSYQFSHHLLGR